MPEFDDRLVRDRASGAIRDGDVRYVMVRADALMGLFKRLYPSMKHAAFHAFADAVAEQGGKSARRYQALGAQQGSALLRVIEETAPSLGWGVWRFGPIQPKRLELTVIGSPFVEGHGASVQPVCYAIVGMLRAASALVLGAPTYVREVRCAAVDGEICRFEAEVRHGDDPDPRL